MSDQLVEEFISPHQVLPPFSQSALWVDEAALRHNFTLLAKKASLLPQQAQQAQQGPHPELMAIIKADAYGHGLVRVASALLRAGASSFGIGNVFEGAKLREALPESVVPAQDIRVFSLLGQYGPDEAELCLRHRIIPFVGSLEELQVLHARATALGVSLGMPLGVPLDVAESRPFPVVIKFNTGMSRLGFAPEDAPELADWLKNQGGLHPLALASHLARADESTPEALSKTRTQAKAFFSAVHNFTAHWPKVAASLCNSAGLLRQRDILAGLDISVPQIFRPGVALYGINPFYGTELKELGAGLKGAMHVSAPVLCVRDLEAGAEISYGGTFVAPRKMRVATLGIGYADGLNRGISRRNLSPSSFLPGSSPATPTTPASFLLRGVRVPLLGRICMQMCVVDVSALPKDLRPGERADILGASTELNELGIRGTQGIRAEELATWADTIPYEIVCSFGAQL